MDQNLRSRIANWHGEQAAAMYLRWSHSANEEQLRDYVRHAGIAERMWAEANLARAA